MVAERLGDILKELKMEQAPWESVHASREVWVALIEVAQTAAYLVTAANPLDWRPLLAAFDRLVAIADKGGSAQ